MKYDITIEWATSKRGFDALRSDPNLGTSQVDALDEAITENVEIYFETDDIYDSFGHWGKAGRTTFNNAKDFDEPTIATFKAEVEKDVGPAIWGELDYFDVTGTIDTGDLTPEDLEEISLLPTDKLLALSEKELKGILKETKARIAEIEHDIETWSEPRGLTPDEAREAVGNIQDWEEELGNLQTLQSAVESGLEEELEDA